MGKLEGWLKEWSQQEGISLEGIREQVKGR